MMKQSSVLCIILFFAIKLSAQLKQGRVMVGGHINYNTNSYFTADTSNTYHTNRKTKNLNFGARVGFLLTDRIMLGILTGQNSSEFQEDQLSFNSLLYQQRSTTYTNSVGLFGRIYKMLGHSNFALFGQVSASLGRGEITQKNTQIILNATPNIYENSGTNREATVYLNLGLTYFVMPRIAVETYFGNLGYRDIKTQTTSMVGWEEETHTRGFYSGLNFNLANIFLGITFYLGGVDETPAPVSN